MRYTIIAIALILLGAVNGTATYGLDTVMDKVALALFLVGSVFVGLVDRPVKSFIPTRHGKK